MELVGRSSKLHEKQEQQELYSSLLSLFSENYCDCQNNTCKRDLNMLYLSSQKKQMTPANIHAKI